jgi:TetR/AcrR family fatty acid metabolism transcriptional regulator
VADGTIYLYFKNKDDILVQFFIYKTKQVFERFREEVDKGKSAREKLLNLVRHHLGEFQRDKIKEMSKMYLDIISEIVEQGQQEGSIRKDLYVSLVKRFIIGSVDEVINTWLHSDGKYDLVSMADPLVELFIRGIGSNEKT